MASLKDGKFESGPIAPTDEEGSFKRADSTFREGIKPDDAEAGRYHLYVSYACPWAHRTIIVRNLKRLTPLIDLSVSNPYMGEKGWTFDAPRDPKYLAEVYLSADKKYTGKITVPVLWDTDRKTIVNNESAEIIRIFNTAFDQLTGSDIDLYPEHLRSDIDRINQRIYDDINNGVYKTGFAANQEAYAEACSKLFAALDAVEGILARQPFLVGDTATEADLRLFTTLVRFDPVYVGHFKCNLRQLKDYHHLQNYLKALYQLPQIRETCHFDHIKEHYYRSHPWINPTGLVPLGPELDLDSSHDRGPVVFQRKPPTKVLQWQ